MCASQKLLVSQRVNNHAVYSLLWCYHGNCFQIDAIYFFLILHTSKFNNVRDVTLTPKVASR